MNGIGATKKEPQRAAFLPSTFGGYNKSPGRRLSLNHGGTLILDFQPPELWEMNVHCLQVTQSVTCKCIPKILFLDSI